MNQSVDGAGGKDSEGQALQQLGNEYSVVGIHGRTHQTQLGAQAGAGHDGDVGHLAAGAASGGDDDQLPLLLQIGGLVVQLVHPLAVGDRQHLGDVNDGAAADAMTRLQPVLAASARIASTITSVGSPVPYSS